MKKVLLLSALIILSAFIGYSFSGHNFLGKNQNPVKLQEKQKKPILRIALVADSHNDNQLLARALEQAKGFGINFVIGLGDYTNTGTTEELRLAKKVFEDSKLEYFVTAGDHDLWDSRDKGEEPLTNFSQIFGGSSQIIDRGNVLFVILDNSDIYKGISQEDWEILKGIKSIKSTKSTTSSNSQQALDTRDTPDTRGTLIFVFAQKTPFHPESKHVMGEQSESVREQAERLLSLLEQKGVDGFFSGDLHFFAEFSSKGGSTSGGKSPAGSVKITTIGAVSKERNFQGPRFGILTVFDDYSWEVEDVEIR